MPAQDRERGVREAAEYFVSAKANNPKPCRHHKPSLEELQSTTFSDYVRNKVLRSVQRDLEDSDDEGQAPRNSRDLLDEAPIHYNDGIAKVSLPKGFCDQVGIAKDETGRGPAWDKGTPLGDLKLPTPIKQVVRGIGGIYEYTFLDQSPITLSEFRTKADDYYSAQVGSQKDLPIETLERKFWRRLGPTMEPSMYGADMNGTLFGEDDCLGWNISKLQSCLQLLLADRPDNHDGGIPGVTTPYLYFGMWASVFCAHTEDMNLLSINYLHAGAPKVWYAIAAGEDAKRFEHFCEGQYHQARSECAEYMRHKRCLVSPKLLKKAGIWFTRTVQYPGDAVITFPGSYHFGFNTGYNVAEATNFAVPEWVPYGKLANVCLCRPDSVRFDMNRFQRLLIQYENEVKQRKRLPWRDWARRLAKKKLDEENENDDNGCQECGKATKLKKTGFWVEVMQPSTMKSATSKTTKSKKSRKRPNSSKVAEVWHLAKAGTRKAMCESAKVLCIMPALLEEDDDDDDEEQCFAGVIIEVREHHARIRFNGMSKKDDAWMPVDSPKLFLDGGRWGDEDIAEELPAKHYWVEEDSKRRCV